MPLDTCPRCGKIRWASDTFFCSCRKYRCRLTGENAEDLEEVYARDAEEAAEKYAIWWNEESGNYPMMEGSDTVCIMVECLEPREPEEEDPIEFEVTAEAGIDYYVTRL